MITCGEAVRQLWEYLDDDLHPTRREDVDRHLARCRRCCGEVEFTAALRQLLRATTDPYLPVEAEGHLIAFLDGLEKEAP